MFNDYEVGLSLSKIPHDKRPTGQIDVQRYYLEQTMDDDL